MTLFELGDMEGAKNELIDALRPQPDDAWSYVVLGNIYVKHDRDLPVAADPAPKYTLQTLPGETFTRLQLMCLMHAGFKRIAPEHDTGMNLDGPFLTALELFNEQRGAS